MIYVYRTTAPATRRCSFTSPYTVADEAPWKIEINVGERVRGYSSPFPAQQQTQLPQTSNSHGGTSINPFLRTPIHFGVRKSPLPIRPNAARGAPAWSGKWGGWGGGEGGRRHCQEVGPLEPRRSIPIAPIHADAATLLHPGSTPRRNGLPTISPGGFSVAKLVAPGVLRRPGVAPPWRRSLRGSRRSAPRASHEDEGEARAGPAARRSSQLLDGRQGSLREPTPG